MRDKIRKNDFQIIAVDFDGTLCTDMYPEIGIANVRLIHLLKELQKEGRKLILWTCRSDKQLEEALQWCKGFQLEFDTVNDNLPEIVAVYGNNSRKIYADVYIDDKTCFPWDEKELQNVQ